MNPLTNMKNVLKLSESELGNKNKSSWHDQYRDSAWIFVGGLPYDLSEGDIICIFSQFGEPVNINLIRDKDSGKSKGYCFLCYEDQRSTILAVDNFNGVKILNRIIRVDHVAEYKVPKEGKKTDEKTKKLYAEGCAATPAMEIRKSPPRDYRETIADQIEADIKLPERLPIRPIKQEILEEADIKLPERLPIRTVKEEPIHVKREDSDDSSKSRKKSKSKKKKKRSSSESSDSRKKSHIFKKKHKKSKRD